MKEQSLQEMMLAIRRNAKQSECIDNFENLIKEIYYCKITDIFISEMSGFLSKLFELFREVDKLENTKLKAKIIHKDFICPEKYFKKSKDIANRLMRLRASVEYIESGKLSNITKNADREDIARPTSTEASNILGIGRIIWPELDSWEEIKEVARKTMLLYHYIPAVYKALIQTKRRELGLDCNSSKF